MRAFFQKSLNNFLGFGFSRENKSGFILFLGLVAGNRPKQLLVFFKKVKEVFQRVQRVWEIGENLLHSKI